MHRLIAMSGLSKSKSWEKSVGRLVLFVLIIASLTFYTIYYRFDSPSGTLSKLLVQKKANNSQKRTKKNEQEHPQVHIFYNLFTKSSEDEDQVRRIVEEQFALVNPTFHEPNVTIISIGHKLSLTGASLGNATYNIGEHHAEGDEYLTLHALWKYCQSNNLHDDAKVVYLHSKGSFHPSQANNKLRSFLTHGALSSECANLPDSCNVCSSRMSPLPHPHTSGNMWLARCDYISKLIDPKAISEGKLPKSMADGNPCKGRGRFFGEHWVHSHPLVKPCDLYTGKEFVWDYGKVPPSPFEMKLQMAPRFNFQQYVLRHWCLNAHPATMTMEGFLNVRWDNYELLYNITTLPEEWWGWDFLKRSHIREE